jgi:hypothetical protein
MTKKEWEAEVWSFAAELAIKEGLIKKEETSKVIVNARIYGSNHSRHDGWSTNINADDWKKIFSIEWKSLGLLPEYNVLKLLEERNNEPLTGQEIADLDLNPGCQGFMKLNNRLKAQFFPFSLSSVNYVTSRGSPGALRRHGKFQLFNKSG